MNAVEGALPRRGATDGGVVSAERHPDMAGIRARKGGFRRAAEPQRPRDTDDMKNSGTRAAGIAARVNQSFHSRGSVRSVAPT